MGFLRYFLAAAVVWSHAHAAGSFSVLSSAVAVTTFFMISGFYMGLVLDTKYGRHTGIFLISRCLRIYPLYYLTLAFAVCLFAAASLWKGHPVDRLVFYFDAWHAGHFGVLAFLCIIQITLVGVDLPCLLSYSAEGVRLLPPFGPDFQGILMERMLFLPHAWTVGFEMVFYLLIPFLKRFRSRTLLVLILLSLAIKISIRWYQGEVIATKWDQQFIVPQFGFFLLGFLSYRHRNLAIFFKNPGFFYGILVGLSVLFFTWGRWAPLWEQVVWWVATLTILPSLFDASKASKADAFFGSLSYPLYLVHVPVRWLMLGTNASYGDAVSPVVLLVFSTTVAVVLALTFENWLESWRARYVKSLFVRWTEVERDKG